MIDLCEACAGRAVHDPLVRFAATIQAREMSLLLEAILGASDGRLAYNLSETPLTPARRSSIDGLLNKRNRVFGLALLPHAAAREMFVARPGSFHHKEHQAKTQRAFSRFAAGLSRQLQNPVPAREPRQGATRVCWAEGIEANSAARPLHCGKTRPSEGAGHRCSRAASIRPFRPLCRLVSFGGGRVLAESPFRNGQINR